MPTKQPSAGLTQRIASLLESRQAHIDALEQIEKTLGQVSAALLPTRNGRAPAKPAAMAPVKRGRARRKAFSMTAEALILSLVKEKKNPTTKEINAAWKKEGRGATADNTLTKLTKEKKLKRTPLGAGIRGSRYSLP
jgi:ferric-dicitrate binding protein FerR (iron transport regulator)